jgi:hypothetical protein
VGLDKVTDIYFLWGTVRAAMMYETYQHWINTMETNTTIYLKAAVHTIEQKEIIESYNIKNCECICINKPGYTVAVNELSQRIEANDNDILLYISDDFYSPAGWDTYLIDKFSNFDGGLFLDDGYQDVHKKEGQRLALTITCITYSCLLKLNRVVLHPDYFHFYSDNEIYQNLKQMNLLKDDRDIDDMTFEHRASAFNKRVQDEYDMKHSLNMENDRETFNRRMQLTLEERLKI